MANEVETTCEQAGPTDLGSFTFSRREAIKRMVLAGAAGGGVVSTALGESSSAASGTGHPKIIESSTNVARASRSSPVAETESGRVRGYSRKGIHIFKGIPYAVDTGGENRFLPAKEPVPWTGVRASLYPSHVCPQPSFTTNSARAMALEQCRMKHEQKSAPAYTCRFDWQSPVLDGRVMAQHGMDLSFVFDNTSKFENLTGDGPEARTLAKRMNQAWIRFAASGDPNHSDIPTWKRFAPSTKGTMVWDNECSYREHLDDDCIKITSA